MSGYFWSESVYMKVYIIIFLHIAYHQNVTILVCLQTSLDW
jgi:hypothetical protein